MKKYFLESVYNIDDSKKSFKIYDSIKSIKDIKNLQLKKINDQWKYLYTNIGFYKSYKDINSLPGVISSLELLNNFPLISKKDINDDIDNIAKDLKITNFTFSGGTSGQITKFPTGRINSKINFINQSLLREYHGINNFDKCLYLWGHSHKYEKKIIKRNYQILSKKIKNLFFNRDYFSAYNISTSTIEKIYNKIKRNRYDYIICYGSILKYLILFANKKQLKFNYNFKVIITSENLEKRIYKIIKEKFANITLINEYGMAETGVIGYNYQDNFFEIKNLWNSFLLQSKDNQLVINELERKVFPLFRYLPDDGIKIIKGNEESIISFLIEGKERPVYKITSNNHSISLSSILIDHILKNFDELISGQYYFDLISNYLYVFVVSENPKNLTVFLNNSLKFYLKNEEPQNIKIVPIEKPIISPAGKFLPILKDNEFRKYYKSNLSNDC